MISCSCSVFTLIRFSHRPVAVDILLVWDWVQKFQHSHEVMKFTKMVASSLDYHLVKNIYSIYFFTIATDYPASKHPPEIARKYCDLRPLHWQEAPCFRLRTSCAWAALSNSKKPYPMDRAALSSWLRAVQTGCWEILGITFQNKHPVTRRMKVEAQVKANRISGREESRLVKVFCGSKEHLWLAILHATF